MTSRKPARPESSDEPAPSLPCHQKLAFDSERQARASATVVRYRYGSQVHPYVCRHCGLWHLSSSSD